MMPREIEGATECLRAAGPVAVVVLVALAAVAAVILDRLPQARPTAVELRP